ncbi:MAG: Xaa-Pro peptidase family protein [Planctomycetota bacterium]|nr:Xaa-Pro peptidase family protein [Planctomycetota bacterium]
MARATHPPRPRTAARLRTLREGLRDLKLACLLVTVPNDIRYLTGFSGEASCAIVTARDLIIISDFRFQEELSHLPGSIEIIIRKGTMLEAQRAALRSLKVRAVGLQLGGLTAAARDALAEALGPRVRLADASAVLTSARAVKDDAELDIIRRAITIQQDALLATLPTVRPGQTERDVAARLEYECRTRGADAMSFETIVAARANGSKPHYRPGSERLARRTPLLIDWGVRLGGYCSDMTRTFALGRWHKRLRDVYSVVLDAHQAAVAAARPGIPAAQLDAAGRDVIRHAGFGDHFGHGLGHGIGLDIHEAPRLDRFNQTILEPGMVVTIEPGIYLPGVGGVRLEDDILITKRGAQNLCSLPKDLDWATLHG